jgi:hypothetical protein
VGAAACRASEPEAATGDRTQARGAGGATARRGPARGPAREGAGVARRRACEVAERHAGPCGAWGAPSLERQRRRPGVPFPASSCVGARVQRCCSAAARGGPRTGGSEAARRGGPARAAAEGKPQCGWVSVLAEAEGADVAWHKTGSRLGSISAGACACEAANRARAG